MRRCFLLLCLLAWGAAWSQTAVSKDALPAKLRYDRPARSAAEQRAKEEAIFQHYAVPLSDEEHLTHAAPRLDTPQLLAFRTRLRRAARTAPVFADVIAVRRVGCGSGCFLHAMVDVRTGASYLSETVSGFAGQRSEFRRNSRAIHVLGLINEKAPGDRWYVWTGNDLKLVYFKPLSDSCFEFDEDVPHIAETAPCDFIPE